jgi:hypothetical protein
MKDATGDALRQIMWRLHAELVILPLFVVVGPRNRKYF